MPTYQTVLPPDIYPFLESMVNLYSAIEKQMHVALLAGEKIGSIEKRLQNEYQVDSTTVRNVHHNLKGKHSGIKELRKTQAKELKSTISSIKKSIATQQKRIKTKLKKQQSSSKHRFIIHQKKRRLAALQQKLKKLQSSSLSLCFGTKKLFLAQYHLEENSYASHQEWLADWRNARASNFVMVGSKTYAGGNQLCRLDGNGNLAITVPPCLIKDYGGKVSCSDLRFRHGQEFVDIALTPTKHKRGNSYRNGTEKAITHRFVRKAVRGDGETSNNHRQMLAARHQTRKVSPIHPRADARRKGTRTKRENKWYLHTYVELPDIPTISNKKNGAIGIDLNFDNIAWAYCDSEGNLKDTG